MNTENTVNIIGGVQEKNVFNGLIFCGHLRFVASY